MKIHRIDGVQTMEVIRVNVTAGTGKDEFESLRPAYQYWSMDGELLAESDPHCPQETNND